MSTLTGVSPKYSRCLLTLSGVRMLGPVAAKKMLDEGWKPSAQEAKEIGIIIQDTQNEVFLALSFFYNP